MSTTLLMVTEQRAREREREAFLRGVSTMYMQDKVPIGAHYPTPRNASGNKFSENEPWGSLAARTFPDVPRLKKRVSRVVEDSASGATREFRMSRNGGSICLQQDCGHGWDYLPSQFNYTEYMGVLADLFQNPFEMVDVDDPRPEI